MAQTNYTPISLYYSTTASAVPTAANLVPGELAINTADGKLYYEDSSGVVQILATKSTGSIGGSNTQVQFNNSGSLGGSSGLTWDGSFLTTSSIKNSALTSGRVTYAGASGLLSDNANFVYDSSERLIVGASSAAIGNRMEVVSNTGSQAIGIRGRVSDGAGVISWHPNASATEYARIQSDSNSALMFGTGSSGTERMRITSAGLVGIGTSSPDTTTLLTVAGAVTITGANSGHGASRLKLGQDTSAISQIRFYGADASTAGILQFTGSSSDGTVGSERMRITSAGNVGIGTSSPNAKLQVTSSSFPVLKVADAIGGGALALGDEGTNNNYVGVWRGTANSISGGGFLNVQGNGIAFMSSDNVFGSASERMRLDSSGNLLVGTTSTITGTKFGATSTTTSGAGEFYVNSAGADAVNAINIIKYSTTNTTAQQFIGFTINNANTGSGQINANGASQAAFGSFSDARLKENIVDLPSQLNNILALKPKEFDYIQSEGGGHQIGFVAQDMQTVYPDAISERTDGMLVVTGWSKTEARLVKAIQEQQALIESLTTRLTALENK